MKYRHRLSRQILLGCLVFTLILAVFITAMSFMIFRNGLEDQYKTRIRDAIDLTMARIDVPDLEACMETGEPSEAFLELMRFMDDVQRNCSLDYIVICRPVKEGDRYDVEAVLSGLSPEERAGQQQKDIAIPQLGDSIGAMYPADFIPVIYDDMINRRDIKFSTSHTEFGTTYDGAVAILNGAGEGVALLTAGLGVSTIEATLMRYGVNIAVAVVAAIAVFLLLMNLWLNRRIVRPLKLIENAASEFAEKSHVHTSPDALVMTRPDIHSGDELEALADTLVTMSEDMKTYAESMILSAVRMESMRREINAANDLALRDALTGVGNKTAFERKQVELDMELEAGKADFGLVMIDLNDLKRINDTFGHDKGDSYLKNACALICNTFSHSPVYRVGGDEFVVVLKGVDLVSREVLFSRFRQDMRTDQYLQPWERVSAAFGLALCDPAADKTAGSVLARADKAMYENKKAYKATGNRQQGLGSRQ